VILAFGASFGVGSTTPADSGPIDGCAKGSDSASFWQRLSDSYQKHLYPDDVVDMDAIFHFLTHRRSARGADDCGTLRAR